MLRAVRARGGAMRAERSATFSRLKMVGEQDIVDVTDGTFGTWPEDADANVGTALGLGAARVAAATAGSLCIYPATLEGSEDAWEVP
jgi:hypothetical protein